VLKAGAAGYMTKEKAPEELIKAIRKVLGGGKCVSESLAEKLAFDLEVDAEKPLHKTLSDREHQVMLMIASGKTATPVSKKLCPSVKPSARIVPYSGKNENEKQYGVSTLRHTKSTNRLIPFPIHRFSAPLFHAKNHICFPQDLPNLLEKWF
jgi:hypothetical protein